MINNLLGQTFSSATATIKLVDAYPNSNVTLVGSWGTNGSSAYTIADGAEYKFNFISTTIIITHFANGTYPLEVILDGVSTTINALPWGANKVVFNASELSSGEHNIIIRHKGSEG